MDLLSTCNNELVCEACFLGLFCFSCNKKRLSDDRDKNRIERWKKRKVMSEKEREKAVKTKYFRVVREIGSD